MRKSSIILIVVLTLSVLGMSGCDRLEIISPPGESGLNAYETWVDAVKRGEIVWNEGTDLPNYLKYIKGEEGKSAYAIWSDWVKEGNVDDPHNSNKKWSADRTSKRDFYIYLTGAKGDDGLTPFVNQKGNWQIGDKDTGIPARGIDGDKGDKGDNGSKGPKGEDGGKGDTGPKGPKGEDGGKGDTGPKGPNGDNGNKGDTGPKGPNGDNGDKGDTGPKGPKGDDGSKGNTGPKGPNGNAGRAADRVTIKNGYWYINDTNTNVPAKGEQGQKGDNGQKGFSAYELWVKEVKAGTIKDKNNVAWDNTKTDLAHFWEYLKGKDGVNGSVGTVTEVEETKFKVISIENLIEPPGPIEHPGEKPQPQKPKIVITVQTEPGATVFYQYSTDEKRYDKQPGKTEMKETYIQSEVYKKELEDSGDGRHTIIAESKENKTLHVWAKAKNKIKSPQHHIDTGVFISNGPGV